MSALLLLSPLPPPHRQVFLLGIAYMLFALWRLIEILERDLGGNTPAAEFMLFIKTRQVGGVRRVGSGHSAKCLPGLMKAGLNRDCV